MRRIAMVCSVVVAGCASSGGPQATPPTPEVVRVQTGSGATMTTSTMPNSPNPQGGVVGYPIDRTWTVMRAVYDSLGIPVAVFEPTSGTIGNANLRLKRRLGDVALSKYINCGNAQGFPSADTYEVSLSVITYARPDASGGTALTTTVGGDARPITISGEPVRCTSLSTLEAKVV